VSEISRDLNQKFDSDVLGARFGRFLTVTQWTYFSPSKMITEK
jgi:hypothetical protein